MKKLIPLLASFFIFTGLNAQVVTRTTSPEGWMIKTEDSAYQMIITDSRDVVPVYYGDASQAENRGENALWTNVIRKKVNWIVPIEEVTVRGDMPFNTPDVEVVFADGCRDLDLVYVSDEIYQENGRTVLKIIQKDTHYPLEVTSFIKVYEEYDILEKWITLRNTSSNRKDRILIENLLSGSLVLPDDNYTLTQLSGYELNEFQIEETPLTTGSKLIESRAFKSNFFGPWFMVKTDRTAADKGPAWSGSLHYSGNWVLKFHKHFRNWLQIAGGINWWDTSWTLEAGASFTSPKMTYGYTSKGSEMASINMNNYIRNEVLPGKFREQLRPVLYNGWENSYFAIDEKGQFALASRASEIGVELFVVDDGWFKGRTAPDSGLGNYDIDKDKFPNGLKPLIDHVHSLGMKFGLWLEPESVSQNADAFQKNPDWTFQYKDRKSGRYRTMLNLADEDVYEHLLCSISKVLSENDIDYIKWDQNTHISEPGWPGAPAGKEREARIRHTANVYRLVEELRRRFPDVLFETCASGGGRVDLGMLSRMDQTWVSDNTDPVDRIFIQEGFAKMRPANTMSSWVTSMTRHQPVSLDFRFDVSMTGILGIGADITKWSDGQMETAKRKIKLYKEIRPTVQHGDRVNLISPYETDRCAVEYTSHDKKSSAVFCYNLGCYVRGGQNADRLPDSFRMRLLDPARMYTVKKGTDGKTIGKFKGDFLMNIGLEWPLGSASYISEILIITEDE